MIGKIILIVSGTLAALVLVYAVLFALVICLERKHQALPALLLIIPAIIGAILLLLKI